MNNPFSNFFKRTCHKTSCVLFVIIIALPASSQNGINNSPEYLSLIDSFTKSIPLQLKEAGVNGCAIAIVYKDQQPWTKGFGFTDHTNQIPVTDSSFFSMQSTTKTLTALAFMMETEKGTIKLDDKLKKIYPGFKINSRFGSDQADKITFRQLLSHWAGFSHEAPLGNNYDERYTTFEDHIKSINDSWLKARVGERYSYSNVGYDIAGYSLQLLSKQSFSNYMKEKVLEPLEMHKTTYSFNEVTDNDSLLAIGYLDEQVPVMRVPLLASGGLYSNAKELAHLVQLFLSGGVYNNSKIISRQSLDKMMTIQFPIIGQKGGYGLGVEITYEKGRYNFSHGGSGYGYENSMVWDTVNQIGVVVLTNGGERSFCGELTNKLLKEFIRLRNGALEGADLSKKKVTYSTLDTTYLQTLTGSYKTYSNVVALKINGGHLSLVRGNNLTRLMPVSRTEFIDENEAKYIFKLDYNKKPVSILVMQKNNVDTWFLNDKPGEKKGDFKEKWKKLIGTYRQTAYGNEFTTRIYEQNGYLYTSRNNGAKLIEYKSNLFLTSDGEVVLFKGDLMLNGYRPSIKIDSTDPASKHAGLYPGQHWDNYPLAESVNWNTEKLLQAKIFGDSIGTTACMIVLDGKVLFQWGNVERKFNVHSIRKSLLNSLYGISIDKGEINLSSTLAELKIDDTPPSLSDNEKKATVRDLLQAKSGVFHPALYETSDMIKSKPPRGAYAHGTYWLYSNWDFNALGTIYERQKNSTIFEEFKYQVANPLQMEDYKISDGTYSDGESSNHPAYPFRMSTRDMARFGLLYMRNGSWTGTQIISENWIQQSTTAYEVTKYKAGVGYGFLWWIAVNGKLLPNVNLPMPSYMAWGTGGHYILVIPNQKLVIVHRVNTDTQGKRVNDEQFGKLVQLILDAKK